MAGPISGPVLIEGAVSILGLSIRAGGSNSTPGTLVPGKSGNLSGSDGASGASGASGSTFGAVGEAGATYGSSLLGATGRAGTSGLMLGSTVGAGTSGFVMSIFGVGNSSGDVVSILGPVGVGVIGNSGSTNGSSTSGWVTLFGFSISISGSALGLGTSISGSNVGTSNG